MSPEFLRANLCFLHGTMTASEGLLQAAIRKGEVDELGLYFTRHLAEERGHLAMLEADLERLGVKRILKFPLAAQLAGAQYYYIEHDHPAMLLGYMAALESNPPTLEQIDALESEHGPLPCTRHHALHDPEHSRELRAQIERLEPELKARALANEIWTLAEMRERVIPTIQLAANHFKAAHA
jgi:hypothetical protein